MPPPAFLTSVSHLIHRSAHTIPLKMTLTPRTPAPSAPPPSTIFLSAAKAAAIDRALMSPPYCHTLDQLMELAGLAVAHAIADIHPPTHVCFICGPGNNGGDGLVAARHLAHFGYTPSVLYPKPQHKPPFDALLHQLQVLNVPLVHAIPPQSDLVVDAIFGFSFRGHNGVREPFDRVIDAINNCGKPVVAVDVPSGWDVDRGPVWPCCVSQPAALVSLTAPKMCVRAFAGLHYVGGRFVPPRLCNELAFAIPEYEGTRGIVRIS